MVVEELVPGEAWISDDSSFYGDEDEQERLASLCDCFNPDPAWRANSKNPSVRLSKDRVMPLPGVESVASISAKQPSSLARLDRRLIEEERLARLNKRKRTPSPERPMKSNIKPSVSEAKVKRDMPKPSDSPLSNEQTMPPPVLFNNREGCPDSWQLGESIGDFLARLPPLTTSAIWHEWIWVSNPDRNSHGDSNWPRLDEFKPRGLQLLEDSLRTRRTIQTDSRKPKGTITQLLNEEGKLLQQRICDLAAETNVLSGKDQWMLFLALKDVTRVWRMVVEAVINNNLGSIAKVAPDDGKPKERLICIYTKDFRDKADVLRVLQELVSMGLVGSGQGIYYKSDPYTYLDIYGDTAPVYGLQASLYSSFKMLAEVNLSKVVKTSPQKQQANINKLFRSI